jgi:transglutaminase-like putative cysteine protease
MGRVLDKIEYVVLVLGFVRGRVRVDDAPTCHGEPGGGDVVRTTENRFLLVVVLAFVCTGSAAGDAADKRFSGPFKITITASKRIHATVTSAYHYPNMVSQEWWVAYPLPPEFAGQPKARGRIRIIEAPSAEPGQLADESAVRQPLATLHWFPDSIDGGRNFTVEGAYNVTINRRTLVSGEPEEPVRLLTKAERSAFLASSNHFDFTSPKFRAWLASEDLKRKPNERDLDFAHRAMKSMVRTYTYRFELKSDRSASAVCKAGWSDCGGLATVYVSILRANGIPARCLSGRNLKPDGTHVRLDFYAEGVGWVPGDPSLAISRGSADAGFGRESTDMVIMHFDLIRFQREYFWLQGIGVVRSINVNHDASGAGMSLDHAMIFEVLQEGDEPAPDTSPRDKSKKRKAASRRRAS